ncbi:hypothetical protein [Mycolicibacterium peregrinum]|uniref:Uncharacterized protein n=1 Tax=Mycolicibacterium peregrinum TaxID=43304 RepID=A0A4Z0HT66_MYCPR|nr:hypothetical protein [Mycolicibacterium peregrinum]TGB43147.1 hypothetical protein EJD94_11310 [Mycolicibacterium peregrinum]TGB44082.1 hypothetical protein EJD98_09410 [Mycolicibacterium peregrinum]
MPDSVRATYAVASDDPEYAGTTYTLTDLDDGSVMVCLEYADGSALEAGYLYEEEVAGLSESELLTEVDQALRDGQLPPRGGVVTPS